MHQLIRIAAIAVLALPAGSVFLAENALHQPNHARLTAADGEAFAQACDATSQPVQIDAADGATLEGWLLTPGHPNHDAAILLHGIADTRWGVLGQAKFLLAAGYTVLAPDSRAHGASGGKLVTYGVLEAEDIHRWADFLLGQPGIERLFGAGQSMGAAILIQSLAVEPRFRAIAADCPFASFQEVARDRLAQRRVPPFVSWPVIHTGLLYARARYHVDLRHASPLEVLRKNTVTPVLLIHGTEDTNIPMRHSRELHAANPAMTELWEVYGAGHVGSVGHAPEAYAGRVTQFFTAHRGQ